MEQSVGKCKLHATNYSEDNFVDDRQPLLKVLLSDILAWWFHVKCEQNFVFN